MFVVPWEENGRLGQQDSADASFIADTPTPTLELSIGGDKQTTNIREISFIYSKMFYKGEVTFCNVLLEREVLE